MANKPAPTQSASDLPTPIPRSQALTSSSVPASAPAAVIAPESTNTGKGKTLKVLLPLVLVALLGIGAFVLVNVLNTPAKVKEKTAVTQPVFESFRRNIQKMAEHLEREPKGDSDSVERYSEEGENLIKDAIKDRDQLTTNKDSIKIAEMKAYADRLGEYMQKAGELIALEEENVKLGKAVALYANDYQKQATEIATAQNYIYSDPDKFLKTMETVAKELERLVEELKKVELQSEMKEAFSGFVNMQQQELTYLKDMKAAVDSRSSSKLIAATQKYQQEKINADEDYNRASDKLEKKIRDVGDELDELADKVDAEYQGLRSKYNF